MPTIDEIYAYLASLPKPEDAKASQRQAEEMLFRHAARGVSKAPPKPQERGYLKESYEHLPSLHELTQTLREQQEPLQPEHVLRLASEAAGEGWRYGAEGIEQMSKPGLANRLAGAGKAIGGPALGALSAVGAPSAAFGETVGRITGDQEFGQRAALSMPFIPGTAAARGVPRAPYQVPAHPGAEYPKPVPGAASLEEAERGATKGLERPQVDPLAAPESQPATPRTLLEASQQGANDAKVKTPPRNIDDAGLAAAYNAGYRQQVWGRGATTGSPFTPEELTKLGFRTPPEQPPPSASLAAQTAPEGTAPGPSPAVAVEGAAKPDLENFFNDPFAAKSVGAASSGQSPSEPFPIEALPKRERIAAEKAMTREQAAQLAANLPPGIVNRYILRPLENIFHRLDGAHEATRLEVRRDLVKMEEAGLLNSPTGKYLFHYGEGDPNFSPVKTGSGLPGPSLPPGLQSVWDEHIQPWRSRQQQLWTDIKQLRKGANLSQQESDQLEFLNPNWMHRRTIASVEKILGRGEEDPTSGVRLRGVSKASSEHDRKLFALVNEKDGSRHLAFLDDNRNLHRISKTFPDGKLVASRQIFDNKDFKPGLGSRIKLRNQTYRMEDAYTREIEDMIPDLKYVKDAFLSTRINVMELQQVKDTLLAQREVKKFLSDENLISRTRHPGWVKADNYPGLSGMYVHPRISAVIERWTPYVHDTTDVYDRIRRAVRALVHSMFWNPLVHGTNVAAHAHIQRGLRIFNPIADIKYLGHFARAWRDVATASPEYMENLRAGARLMYGNQLTKFDRMNELMFKGLKDLQETPEGKGLLTRFNKMTGIPISNFVKGLYQVSGDALWFGGDVLLQAAIREERALLKGPRKSETLAQTIMRIHKEIPPYRIPTEEIGPGVIGQTISKFVRHPATNATLLFMPYHENVVRSMAMQAEDLMNGVIRIRNPSARQEALSALSKVIMTGITIGYIYPKLLDPIAKKMFGDEFEMRGFGPFALLKLMMDYHHDKQLSPGAGLRALSGGFYSPSPLVEIPFNLAGAHAYSGTALQPTKPPFRHATDWQSVPWNERLGTAATSITPVTGQIRDVLREGLRPSWPSLTGFAAHSRKMNKKEDPLYELYHPR
jgi:hypothetical protein